MAATSTFDEINSFETFKSQVLLLNSYLSNLEGEEFQRSCILLESIFKPHFDKNKMMHFKVTESREIMDQLKISSDSERHLNIDSPHIANFDSEQVFSEKFLNGVPDDSFLQDTLLMQNNILDEKANSIKGHCFEKISHNLNNKFSQSISLNSEDNMKYEYAFKDNTSLTYLDLSHKSNYSPGLTAEEQKLNSSTSESQEKNLESHSELILNLCSKKTINLKNVNEKGLQYESNNITEDFDNISYHINTSNLLLEERLLGRNDSISSNSDLHNFNNNKSPHPEMNDCNSTKSQAFIRDDITKIFTPAFNSNVTQSTNSLKEDKKIYSTNNEYSSYISEVESSLSLSNEATKSCFNQVKIENTESLINIDCDSAGILNLKKQTICNEKDICNKSNIVAQDSSSSINLGFYALFKNSKAENCMKALNLVNKKCKSLNLPENLNSNSESLLEKRNCFKDIKMSLLSMDEKSKDEEISTSCNFKHGPVCCRKCQTEFPDFTLWNEHKNECSETLFCIHCDIQLNSKSIYDKHMASHKRNTCSKCPSTFRRHQLLRAHMKLEHGINLVSKTYPCEHCPRVFMKKSSIFYHLQTHALPHQKVCPKCGKFIEGETAFSEHMDEHVKNAFFRCHLCSAIFERIQQYNDHMEGHKKHVCVYCEKNIISFSSKKLLFNHYKTEHPDLPQKVVLNKKYNCDQCPRIFTRPSLLKDHKLTHTDMQQLQCRYCNKKYVQRSSLKKHLKKVHLQNIGADGKSKNKNYCQQCGTMFTSLNLLNKHSVAVHNMVINHFCTYCDYKTKHRKLLKRHMDTHLEKKKHLCDICGSLFQCSSTLKHHTIFLHSNERRFKCKECDKSFKNNSCLSRHTRTHSNERPYKCECGSCYKQLSHLSRHLSSAHNKKLNTRRIKRVVVEEVEDNNSKLCFDQNMSISANADSSLITEVERSNDILLTSGNTVIMTEGTVPQDSSPLFTVLDSQLIHLIPSTLQLQEGIHTVSLVNGELHTLAIAPSAYQISQEESFATNATNETILIHSSDPEATNQLTLEEIHTRNTANLNERKVNSLLEASQNGQKISDASQIDIVGGHEIQFATSSLTELHYRDSVEEDESIHALASTHYLTHQDSTLSQDIGNSNISIF